ncbi:MAG: TRAP transporter substrate-binding protein [Deltaproteobacteria bacterium]|nr:TRAP transporter substrate-binding protein [Deltaproteobacteria bacterium]
MQKRLWVLLLAVAFILTGMLPSTVQAQEKVVIRFCGDFPTAPHPLAVAMGWFRDRMKERLPGSEVRLYFAGGLYNMGDAMTALQAGNLEIAVGQPSKVAGFDPWLNIATLPMLLTSVGAIHHFPETETAKMLAKRLSAKGVEVLEWSDISHFFGACAKKRLLSPADFKGMKVRTLAPLTQVPMLRAWGASGVAMSWGDVPSALQSGVVDAALTSTGGWASVRDQIPFNTIAGVGGVALDFYFFGVSKKWLDGLKPETRKIVTDTLHDLMMHQRTMQWCSDKIIMDEFGTKDPKKPGVYVVSPEQVEVFKKATGDAVANSLAERLGGESKQWIFKFMEEGNQLVKKYPIGSDLVESLNCAPYKELLSYKEQEKPAKKK